MAVSAFDLSSSNPTQAALVHRSQGIELYFVKRLDLATVTTALVQVHDDTLNLDLGVLARATVVGYNSDATLDRGTIALAPVNAKHFGRGHQLTVTLVNGLKYLDTSNVTPATYTFTVADRPEPLALLHPENIELLKPRWTARQGIWGQHRKDLEAWDTYGRWDVASVPWVGRPADSAEISAWSTGSYNAGRGAWADAERARIDAIFYRMNANDTRGDAAKDLIMSWVNTCDPGPMTDTDDDNWQIQGLSYSVVGHLFLNAYEWCYDRFSTAERAAFYTWLEGFGEAVVDSNRRDSTDTNPDYIRDWCNSFALRLAVQVLSDYRRYDWVFDGTTTWPTETGDWANPFPLITKQLEEGIEASDYVGGPYPRIWDWRRHQQSSSQEVTRPVAHFQAWAMMHRLLWNEAADAQLRTYRHPTNGYGLDDIHREYERFVRKNAGYDYVEDFGDVERVYTAWALMGLWHSAAPTESKLELITQASRGPFRFDSDEHLAVRSPAFSFAFPNARFTECGAPPAPEIPTDYETTWTHARTWVRGTWDQHPPTYEGQIVYWQVSQDGTVIDTTTEPEYCWSNLVPDTGYRVAVTAVTECGEATVVAALWLRTKPA